MSDPLLAKWTDRLQFALDLRTYQQAEHVGDGHWRVPRSESDGFAHVTVQRGRVVACSCAEGRRTQWWAQHPCYHGAGVVLALHRDYWAEAGLAWDWSVLESAASVLPVLLGYLPEAVGASMQREAA